MKTFAIGALTGALAGVALVYLVLNARAAEGGARENPHSAVIVLKRDGVCKAKVDNPLMGNKRNMKVYWAIDVEEAGCVSGNNWTLELRFDNAKDGTVWNNGRITVRPNGTNPWKIPPNANIGTFPYHVWYVPEGGTPIELADPEIQIEM